MYATIAQVKNYTLREIDSAFESAVTEFIEMAGSFIDNFCGRSFEPVNDDTEATVRYFDGNDSDSLEIDDLQSLTSISIFGVGVELSSLALYPANEIPKTLLKFKSDYGLLGCSRRPVYQFDRGQQNVAVTGVWGYDREVPKDITLACLKIVGAIIKENIGEGDANEITRESIGDYSVEYQKVSDIAHALKVEDILVPYVREKSGTSRTGNIKL